jgi:HPt (histidine-containing phosphotransfer) domain-containing protein
VAHTIKGNLRLFGPTSSARIAERVEMAAAEGDAETGRSLAAALVEPLRSVLRHVENRLQELR